MPDPSSVLRVLSRVSLCVLALSAARGQELPTVSVGGTPVDPGLVRREALRLFAAPALEDLATRFELEQVARILVRAGIPTPARSIDDPIATQDWIDRLVIPERPEHFAPLELLGCAETSYGQAQQQLRERLRRLASADPAVRPISDLERGVVRGLFQRSVLRDATERWAWCELGPNIALCAGGASMDVVEAWQRCATRIGELAEDAAAGPAPTLGIAPEERRRRALRHAAYWTAAVSALARDLQERGALLGEEEWRRFAVETLGRGTARDAGLAFQVLPGLGLPSAAAFATYAWLRESYSRGVLGRVERAEIEAALAECDRERATGKIDVDVLLFAAYDFAHAHPLPEQRTAARERAAECARRLAAGEDFAKLMEELSEFQDLRTRTRLLSGEKALAKTNRGRLRGLSPQTLDIVLGSTPFDLMTGGTDLARAVLEELPVGEVSGPIECTFGTCFVRVGARDLGAPAMNLERPAEIQLAREMLLTRRFELWVVDVVARAGIEVR
jgi:hypothetical protein